jgi:hypothetical protein
MSLPIHLQSIKSSGVYRFVYDKSVISGSTAETLRLLVGYSDKGPFNTPVYITSRDEFIKTYGNISKRLEKKGVYFHRLALEALNAGPILCLNLKPFTTEKVGHKAFNVANIYSLGAKAANNDSDAKDVVNVTPGAGVYDTNRFWTLNAEDLVDDSAYMVISATDTKDASCSVIMRKAIPEEYDLTIREYYAGVNDEMPDYLIPIADTKLNEYFMDIYVFRGEFTENLCGPTGVLGRYFNVSGTGADKKITLEENYTNAFGEEADALVALANDPASNYIAGYRGTTIPFFKNANGSYISLDILFNSGYTEHKMLMNMNELKLTGSNAATLLTVPYLDPKDDSTDGTPGPDMTSDTVVYKVKNAANTTYTNVTGDDLTATVKKKAVEVTAVPDPVNADSPKYIKITTVVDTVTVNSTEYDSNIQPLYVEGFDYTSLNSATTPTDFTNACIGVITGDYGKGLQEALTNRVDVEYHYLVDTFDTATSNNKLTLAALAKKKDNCFAILNFAKVSEFKKDSTNFRNNTLDWSLAAKKFILPGEGEGASWCGYFTQVVLTDGTVKTTVPSAGLVSNLFMNKWSSRQPYYIVAGSQYGRLLDSTLVGPDYGFSKTDRDVLEPYGINVIVYEPRRGTYINSEQTAKQIPVSALSKIHIRELVIYLQDEIAELLEGYRWELNTQVLRDKIKAKADVILETVKNNGGVYDYLNVCDDSNNTGETIDNEFLILDTHIEPARGAGKMVEQLYIYRTGEMRSVLLQG